MGISTAAAIGLAVSAVGTGVAAYGAIQQSNAASDAANYNAQVAANNQKIAQQKASAAAAAGDAQAAATQQKTRATVGAIAAAQAAGNIDVNSGSAVDVRSSSAELGELDAISVRQKAAQTAYGYQTDATSFQDQSNLDTSQAENASAAGGVSATGSILGGVGSAATNWAKYQTQAAGSMTAPGDFAGSAGLG